MSLDLPLAEPTNRNLYCLALVDAEATGNAAACTMPAGSNGLSTNAVAKSSVVAARDGDAMARLATRVAIKTTKPTDKRVATRVAKDPVATAPKTNSLSWWPFSVEWTSCPIRVLREAVPAAQIQYLGNRGTLEGRFDKVTSYVQGYDGHFERSLRGYSGGGTCLDRESHRSPHRGERRFG